MDWDDSEVDSTDQADDGPEEWFLLAQQQLKAELSQLYEQLRLQEVEADEDGIYAKDRGGVSTLDRLVEDIILAERYIDTPNVIGAPSFIVPLQNYLRCRNLQCDQIRNRLMALCLRACLNAADSQIPDEGSTEYLKSLWREHAFFGSITMLGLASLGWAAVSLFSHGDLWLACLCALLVVRLALGSWFHQQQFSMQKKRAIMAKQVLRLCLVEVRNSAFDPRALSRRLENAEANGILCSSLIYSLLADNGARAAAPSD